MHKMGRRVQATLVLAVVLNPPAEPDNKLELFLLAALAQELAKGYKDLGHGPQGEYNAPSASDFFQKLLHECTERRFWRWLWYACAPMHHFVEPFTNVIFFRMASSRAVLVFFRACWGITWMAFLTTLRACLCSTTFSRSLGTILKPSMATTGRRMLMFDKSLMANMQQLMTGHKLFAIRSSWSLCLIKFEFILEDFSELVAFECPFILCLCLPLGVSFILDIFCKSNSFRT
jgi:hypothetical protein